jgi:hypothetical protein
MDKRNEFQHAFEILLKFEDRFREAGVPEEKYEFLLRLAHTKIRLRKDIEEILDVIEKLCDLL